MREREKVTHISLWRWYNGTGARTDYSLTSWPCGDLNSCATAAKASGLGSWGAAATTEALETGGWDSGWAKVEPVGGRHCLIGAREKKKIMLTTLGLFFSLFQTCIYIIQYVTAKSFSQKLIRERQYHICNHVLTDQKYRRTLQTVHICFFSFTFQWWGRHTGSISHIQQGLNDVHVKHTILLPQIQDTDNFVLKK